MIQSGTAVWFARHESRLAWRDWLAMMTAGKRERRRRVAIGFVAFVVFMHAVAWFVVGRFATATLRQANAGRDHRDPVAVVAADGFAGHGIDDARFLFARRSRSHPRFAGGRA